MTSPNLSEDELLAKISNLLDRNNQKLAAELERHGDIRRDQFNEIKQTGDERQKALVNSLSSIDQALGGLQGSYATLQHNFSSFAETLNEIQLITAELKINVAQLQQDNLKKRKQIASLMSEVSSINDRITILDQNVLGDKLNRDRRIELTTFVERMMLAWPEIEALIKGNE